MPEAADTTTLAPKNPEAFVKSWMKEISDALKREKKYRKLGQECVKLYEAKEPDQTPFAILYSNTETLVPAIYNSLPIPIVQRKFRDPDPVGKSVSEVSTRVLKYLLDNENKDYDCLDDLFQGDVLDGVVTNRGLSRFRYSANPDGSNECVYGERVRWDKFFHGYARTWKKVPWVGFEWDFSREELKKNFPKAVFEDLRFTVEQDGEDSDDTKAEDRDELAGVKTYKVYEIWDKDSGKVFFISPVAKEPLRYIDDPLGLSSFFPVPKPLNFMRKITTLVPTPLYQQYRSQAAELNELTRRLKAIIRAIKFRGAYNSAVEGIEKMLNAEDNELVPVDNIQSMPDGTGMDKLLWTVPVNELATTAQNLYQQREAVKQVIYEISGISDILRGSSVASETATAQNLKNQWGTLRLRRMQREVQRYCRDAIAIMLEIAASKFEVQTLRQMTGLGYLTDAEKQQIQQQVQIMEAQAQAAAAQHQSMGGQPSQPGQPPQPGQGGPPPPPQAPPIPPEIQQALQAPSWEDIDKTLKNTLILHYKVDIETNSTIEAQASQDKQDMTELMTALGQFLTGIEPLVQSGVFTIDVAKSMLLIVCRRFTFGSQMEDAINAMQAPKPPTDPAADAKTQAASAQANVALLQAQHDQRELEGKMALADQEFQNKKTLMAMEHEAKMADIQVTQAKSKAALAGIQQKAMASAIEHEQRLAMMKADAASDGSGGEG